MKITIKHKLARTKSNKSSTGLFGENYKGLLKDIKEDRNKWRAISYSWLKDNIIKMLVLYKLIQRFTVTQSQVTAVFSKKLTSWFQNQGGKAKDKNNSNTPENEQGGIFPLPNVKAYYKAITNKTVDC